VEQSLCLVTVHGIGFQQPPRDGQPGYADALHEHLHAPEALGDRLGDDPNRPGPVYVESEADGSRGGGLARLDPEQKLAPEGKIAHVALVYTPSEPLQPRLGSVADTLARAVLAHGHYISALGALRLALDDAWAALHEHKGLADSSTLRPRTDLELAPHHHRLALMLHGHRAKPAPAEPGLLGIFRALEDDMATYVARNDLRERVRGFVEEALLKVFDRPDISGVVLNTHSQGTMIGWDVLCRLPFFAWREKQDRNAGILRAFVTAGSPIRKYVDLFAWGEQVGQLAALLDGSAEQLPWHNFWDVHDPVADPLDPATAWRPGRPLDERPEGDKGLLIATNPANGDERHVDVLDAQVDNVEHSSGGGLQAHDYWNNRTEFVAGLADVIKACAG
jgi:hypothetical protein